MSEKIWFLKSCKLFENLTPEQMHRLELCSRIRNYAKRSPVYLPAEQADDVLLLTRGRVKICHLTSEGKQSILAFIEPGELFGELAILDAGTREEYAEAVEKTSIVSIPKQMIQQLMEQHAELSLGITKLMGLRRMRIEKRVKNLLFLSNRERLSHLLLELVEQYGKLTDAGIEIAIKLSHQDLANIIGSTRETVTVVLGELQAEKLLTIGRRKIVLTAIHQLAQSVQAPVPRLPQPEQETMQLRTSLRTGFSS
ncbi:MAG: transcriptional regulator [Blastopirellula sp.]|nr:MAG: transcriptional regulator [Blastopirellula sp.]